MLKVDNWRYKYLPGQECFWITLQLERMLISELEESLVFGSINRWKNKGKDKSKHLKESKQKRYNLHIFIYESRFAGVYIYGAVCAAITGWLPFDMFLFLFVCLFLF